MARQVVLDHSSIANDYANNLSVNEISLRNNCSPASVSRIAREYNILRTPASSSKHINHSFFFAIGTENAHWLIFVRNNGYISKTRNLISISVKPEQEEELLLFRAAIGAENKKVYKSDRYVQFQFTSEQMINDLRKWGFRSGI